MRFAANSKLFPGFKLIARQLFLTLVTGLLFTAVSHAQYTSTWTLIANKSAVVAGPSAANVTAGDMIPGTVFAGGTHNNDGFKCQPTSGNWPTVPTDGYNVDYPLSPVAGFDLTITGLVFRGRTSGSSGNNIASLAYQADGAGPWIPFGGTVSIPSGGSTTGITFANLNLLLNSNHTYLIRMYLYAAGATTSASRSLSLRDVVFSGFTPAAGNPPTVVTVSAAATGKYTATMDGSITNITAPVTVSGAAYGLAANPDITGTKTNDGTASGNFTSIISGLTAGTTYHVRAYATTGAGTAYGDDKTFTTDAATTPIVSTTPAINIAPKKATSGGNVSDSGGFPVIARGVVWNTTGKPLIPADVHTTDGTGIGTFISELTGLTPSTTYFYRAYATNSLGTDYGQELQFTTLDPQPEIVVIPNNLAFGAVIQNTSSQKSYTLTGALLNPAAGSLQIDAPAGYQVSLLPGSGFASSIQVPYTNGTIAATTIYVRFTPGAIAVFNGTITNAGGSAPTETVTVTGTGIESPLGFSNKGADFWVGYATHENMYSSGGNNPVIKSNGGGQTMVLYFTSDKDANVTVSIPGLAYFPGSVAVAANTVTEFTIPNQIGSDYAQLYKEGKINTGIHIEADQPIVAYAHIYNSLVSGASLLLPTKTWGIEYNAITYNQQSNSNAGSSYNYFFVIAKEDGTMVEITPSAATIGGWAAGVPQIVTLNKGEIYNVLGATGTDFTGSHIKALDCAKKIGVFSGSGRTIIQPCGSGSSDNLIQQVFPRVAWGKKYLTSPTIGSVPENLFRVCVQDPLTEVTINGIKIAPAGTVVPGVNNDNPIFLDPASNFFYEFSSAVPVSIVGSKPVMVAQYNKSVNGCVNPDNTRANGDPEMIFISPVEQAINSAVLFSPSRQQISFHYINIIIPKGGVSSFTLDGVNMASEFQPHPQDANYSYASFDSLNGQPLFTGQHIIKSDSSFNAIAYGYADANTGSSDALRESYGYNAGTEIRDLSADFRFVSSGTAAATVVSNKSCVSTPTTFKLTIPYQPSSIVWDFNGVLPTVTVPSPVVDSSYVKDGITLYVYKLTGTTTFTSSGSYPIKVTATNPATEGCVNDEISYLVEIQDRPKADFTPAAPVACVNAAITFTETATTNGNAITKWQWNFDDNTAATTKTVQKAFATAAAHEVKLWVVTNIGCTSDTAVKRATINPLPTVALAPLAGACNTQPAFALTGGTPAGGTYSGTGVSNGQFNPAVSGVGTFVITYTFTSQAGCTASATQSITVNAAATAVITAVPAQCTGGQAVALVATPQGGVFAGPGVSGTNFNPATAGVGSHTITYSFPNNPCILTANTTIVVNALPTVNAGPDLSTIQGVPITLQGSASNGTYLWTPPLGLSNPAILGPVATPQQTTQYTLTATSNGCSASDDMTLTVNLPCNVDPARAFTPNGDGFNDLWIIGSINTACILKARVDVYNRWGAPVYHAEDYRNNWDGRYKGDPLPDGTYYFIVTYTNAGRAYPFTIKGNVTIIR